MSRAGSVQKYRAISRREDSDGLQYASDEERVAPEDEPTTCMGRLWGRFKHDFGFVYAGGYGTELRALHDEQSRNSQEAAWIQQQKRRPSQPELEMEPEAGARETRTP